MGQLGSRMRNATTMPDPTVKSATIAMPEASGSISAGRFYYDLEAKKGLTTLLPGESTSVTIKFVYPMTSRLAYSLEFWGAAF